MADETAPIYTVPEETSLIRKPYIDRLAAIQSQKNLEKIKEIEAKKRIKKEAKLARDKMQASWHIGAFLRNKFPDAFSPGEIDLLPQKEFKDLFKRSRNWIWKKVAVYCSGFMASMGGIAGSIAIVFLAPSSIFWVIPFFIGLIGGVIGLAISLALSIEITKVLFYKGSEKNFMNL